MYNRTRHCSVGVGNGAWFEALFRLLRFGILSLASICPIIAVLTIGVIIQIKQNRNSSKIKAAPKELENA